MTIAQILNAKGHGVVTIDTQLPVRKAIRQLNDFGIGALLVLDRGEIAGIFSERDVVQAIARHGETILDLPVQAVMTTDIVTVDSECSVVEAMGLITHKRIRHLPVVDSGTISGIVSIGDLVKRRIELSEMESDALRDYISSI